MVNSTASSELQVELLPRLSRNLSHCCEKGLSAPGVGFSNFETNYLFFSSISRTKRLRMWSFWYDKWFCSFKNLFRVLPNLRSNAKVSFDGGGGARDQCGIPSVCGGIVANRFGLLVLCFSDSFFVASEVNTEGFVKYFLRLRSNGKEKRVIFLTFVNRPIPFTYIPPTGNERGRKPLPCMWLPGILDDGRRRGKRHVRSTGWCLLLRRSVTVRLRCRENCLPKRAQTSTKSKRTFGATGSSTTRSDVFSRLSLHEEKVRISSPAADCEIAQVH